ncbi:hypothetical protein HOC01_01130 [archaeon]|nr:hypothetical protein [archaeon]MBT6698076.1 hypothetical protein [archaeon]
MAIKKRSSKRSTSKRSSVKRAPARLSDASSFIQKEKMELHKVAHYCFLIGLLIALVAGLPWFAKTIDSRALMTTLVLLGFIVGLFNLTTKDTMPFLVASIALMLAGIVNLSLIPVIGEALRSMLSNIVVFVVPGAIVLAVKTVYTLASK